ncbi:MAG: CHAT domain-containing protein [Acidobacteriota bacterium]
MTNQDSRPPIPDIGTVAEIDTGDPHGDLLELEAGRFVILRVEQLGADVALRLTGPGTNGGIEVDSPTGRWNAEELAFVTPQRGIYDLEIAVLGQNSGTYRVVDYDIRKASVDDHRYAQADRVYRGGRKRVKEALRIREQQEALTEALALLEPSLDVWRSLGAPLRIAWTLEEIAKAKTELDRRSEALEHHLEAIALCRGEGQLMALANHQQRAASLEAGSGLLTTAEVRLREAISIFETKGESYALTMAMAKLGHTLGLLGRYEEGLDLMRRALAELGDRDWDRAAVATDLAATLLSLDRWEEAENLLEDATAAAIASEHGRAWYTGQVLLARARIQGGDPTRALADLRDAFETGALEGMSDYRRSFLLQGLAYAELRAGDVEAAQGRLGAAVELADADSWPQLRGDALLGLGYAALQSDDPQMAVEHYEQALELYSKAGSATGIVSCQARLAEALRESKRPEEAWTWLQRAVVGVEALRAATGRQDHGLSYFAFRQEYFDIGLGLLSDRIEDQKASAQGESLAHSELQRSFHLAERRYGRALRDAVGRGDLSGAERYRDPELLAVEVQARDRLRGAVEQGSKPEELEARLAEVHVAWGALEGDAPSRAPTLGLDAVQEELLDGSTLLLMVELGENGGVLWAIERDGLAVHALQPRSKIEHWAATLTAGAQATSPQSQRSASLAAKGLSAELLAPVAPALSRTERVVFVAGGALQTTPLALLPHPEGTRHLVETHEISMLPSASLLRALRARSGDLGERPRRVAVLADPVFGTDDPRMEGGEAADGEERDGDRGTDFRRRDRAAADHFDGSIPRLPGSGREGRRVIELAGEGEHTLREGFDATPESLFDVEGEGATHLHIASHGLSHRRPELAGLLLAGVNPDGGERSDQGFVPAFDISRRNLGVQLAVLSACNTGKSGTKVGGEGSMSLAWSFLSGGAQRVVSTLWQVDDDATARFMDLFYDAHFRQGLTAAAALRHAQRTMLADPESRTRDWAGFVLHGDWD